MIESSNTMKVIPPKPIKSRIGAVIKALVFIVFILAAIYIIRFTPIKEFFTQTALSHFWRRRFLAPVFFILVYAVGVCLFVPGTLLTALGAAIFGAYWGFLYVWIGAMIGASVAFWIGRTLAENLRLPWSAIASKSTMMPLHGMDWLRCSIYAWSISLHRHELRMGLTKVRFRDYFAGRD